MSSAEAIFSVGIGGVVSTCGLFRADAVLRRNAAVLHSDRLIVLAVLALAAA